VKLARQVRGALSIRSPSSCIMIIVMTVLADVRHPRLREHVRRVRRERRAPEAHQARHRGLRGFVTALPFIIVGVIGQSIGFTYFYRTPQWKRSSTRLILKLPILGPVLQKIAVARFTRTLGTLLSSGVPILDALDIVAKTAGNVIIEEGLRFTRARISEGKNMAEPLAEVKVFPGMVVQMVAVGEQTGALDTMLNKIADFYEDEVDVAVASLTSLLEPILMVMVGSVVGVVLVSMYLPIFDLAGKIKGE
jgi:type IV pilus assembly protein PilC